MYNSLLSLKMISFVLFPQASQPSMNFNISDMYIFLKTEKKIPFFKSIRIRVDKVLNYLPVSWESTGVYMLFLKLSSNVSLLHSRF